MALTEQQIEAAGADAWTGKATSIVYTDYATAIAFLALLPGTSALAGAGADEGGKWLFAATTAAEDEIRNAVRGMPVTKGQGLIFPASGAYDSSGVLIDRDTAPAKYLEGIYLIGERMAAGDWMADVPKAGVKIEAKGKTRTEWFEGGDASSIAAQHPDIWMKIATAIPYLG